MLLAFVLSGVLVAAQEPPMQSSACNAVNTMKGKSVPSAGSAPPSTIVHGALLYFGDDFAGAVYGTQANTVWYQGTGKFSDTVSGPARDRAITMLGIAKDNANATLVEAPKPSFVDALAPDVKLRGCF